MDEKPLHDAAWRERIACVLSGALRAWGVSGTVVCDAGGRFVVSTTAGAQVRIAHRAGGGWLVFPADEHAGLPGLLRHLREELAPYAAAGRLVIGAQPLLEEDFR
jgi:hypothetical protein